MFVPHVGRNTGEETTRNQGSRASKDTSSTRRVGTGVNVETAAEGSFVPYLPQDEAVLAGLGEREGGVDASETQEVTDLLNEQLSALLCLPSRQFWKKVVTDESLGVFLDSYLHFRRRWFDIPVGRIGGSEVSVVAGDGDLSRRVFMVLLRMSSNHDPGSLVSESLSAKEHAVMLQERNLLDIPKLMDISAIYGRHNPDLTRQLVSNVFKSQPGYVDELVTYIPLLLERIITMHQRCCVTIDAITSQRDFDTIEIGGSRVQEEFVEVIEYLNDCCLTLKAFITAYPPVAHILVSSGDAISGLGSFLPVLARVHDTLLPYLRNGFAILSGSVGGNQHDKRGEEVAAQDLLFKLGERLVDLSWQLIKCHFLSEEDMMIGGVMLNKLDKDPVERGESLVQAILMLAMGPFDNDRNTTGKLGSSGAELVPTGALLQSIEKRHGLYLQVRQACQRGSLILNDAQEVHLSALITGSKSPTGVQERSLIMATESLPTPCLEETEVEEETVIQQSKISQVKDLFPDYGDGFIAACLEAYDSDPEKVIQRILEGTLHSDLLSLDTSLKTRPNKMLQSVKDKGKGKVSEQPLSGKGKAIWEEKIASRKASTSSSSLSDSADASRGHFEVTVLGGSLPDPDVKVGRFVRRPNDNGTFSELLDGRDSDKHLRSAIKAAAAQMEYEDEYDDSFDELGGYVADAGGNEETESLADQVSSSGGAREEKIGMRNNGRPSILTPWGTNSAKGRVHPVGEPRASFQPKRLSSVIPDVEGQADKLSKNATTKGSGYSTSVPKTVLQSQSVSARVPEVDGQGDNTPVVSAVGQGRGGRGKKKWKEQGPKPQYYLKDGKLYSYKVAGATGVSSIEEAEAIKQEETATIYGLGEGGNISVQQQDTNTSGRNTDTNEDTRRHGHVGTFQAGGRGRGGNSRGRCGPGRGSYRKETDNHNRKENAMKKHFGGLGGL